MGGFSTLLSMYMDEMNALQTGYRMIHAGISVGSDYSYAAAVAPQDQLQAAYGSRTVGMIAGQYDEFFFNKSDEEKTAEEKKFKAQSHARTSQQQLLVKPSWDSRLMLQEQRQASLSRWSRVI